MGGRVPPVVGRRRVGAVALLASMIVLLLQLASSVGARTIVLVYDDSGSMRGQRYAMANYATQNLAALLAPGDTLAVVRMSRPDHVETLLPERGIEVAVPAIAAWPLGGGTPYTSVQTAIGFLEDAAARVPAISDTEDYWLVVFSDGEFNDFGEDMTRAQQHYVRDLDALRETFRGRKLGVVYLGISEGAQIFADPWEAAGATTFTAFENDAIANAMFSIAAMITGRDVGDDAHTIGLQARPGAAGGVDVVSTLPLRRLIVFYQGEQPVELSVDPSASELVTTVGERVPLRTRGPYATAGGSLYGVINAVEAETLFRVLRPGTFNVSLTSDGLVELDDLRFLPEVALDLHVDASQAPGVVCAGDTIELVARLQEPGHTADFRLDNLIGLDVRASVEADANRGSVVPFSIDGTDRMIATLTVPEGRSTVSISARFPGYFDLRSRLLGFEGVPCVQDLVMRVSPTHVDILPTTSTDLIPVDAGTMQLDGASPGPAQPASYRLQVTGLPTWMALAIDDRTFDNDTPRHELELTPGVPVAVTLLHRNPSGADRQERYDVRVRAEAIGAVPVRWSRQEVGLVVAPQWADLVLRSADASPGEPVELDIRRTPSQESEPAATFSLVIDDEAGMMPEPSRYRFTAEDVPVGVTLRIEGVPAAAGDHIDLMLGREQALQVVVERDARYRLEDLARARLRVEALDHSVQWGTDTVTLHLRPLSTRVALSVDPDSFDVPYTGSDGLESAGVIRLVPTVTDGALDESATVLQVRGLPEGVVLRLGITDIDVRTPEAPLPTVVRPVELEVLRDASFRTRSAHTVTFDATSSDRAVRWSSAILTIAPAARVPGLAWRDPPAASRVDRLYGARFPALAFADAAGSDEHRTQTSQGELADWEIAPGVLPAGLRARAHRDVESNIVEIELVPRSRLLMFTVPTGNVEIPLTIVNTSTGERAETNLALHIDDVGWWEKSWRAIAALLGLVAAAALSLLVLAWWRRPRFRRGAGVEYSEANDWVDAWSEDAPERIHRRAVLFARHLIGRWTLHPQRAAIDSLTFRATRRTDIVLEAATKRQRGGRTSEGDLEFELASVSSTGQRFSLRLVDRSKDTPIRMGDELAMRRRDGPTVYYRYLTGLPDYR